jgi:deoxyribodipyrimidine photolyase
MWDTDSLSIHYVGATMTTDPAKSCMRDKAFFKISPWLAHGCISPRRLYHEVRRYEKERKQNKSTGWIIHELIWRDYARFGAEYYGTKIFRIGGMDNLEPRWVWSWDVDRFQAWQQGRTGIPFIDVFMRELSVTGYCNHMGRETAGWFLIADLGIDWRMGAEWFESMLIDFEPAANWFNWAYRCLPACTAKSLPPMSRLQTVEALKWCAQHDPDAAYIKRWLPELKELPSSIAREPWRVELGNTGVEEARGRSGGVLDGRIGEIGTAVPSAVTAPTAKQNVQPGKDGAPKQRFTVSRRDLQEVMSLGFLSWMQRTR